MKLKKSLNFRGYPDKNEIIYYDGESKSLEIDNFELIWSLFEILQDGTIEDKYEEIIEFQSKFSITNDEFEDILTVLKEHHILYKPEEYKDLFRKDFDQRNFNFFSNFDSSPTSSELINKLHQIKVVIIGVGTIGSTLALTLAKLGIKELILIDFDTVQLKNIRAQVLFNLCDVNHKKVDTIKYKLEAMDPYIKVTAIDKAIKTISDLDELQLNNIDYIFGCFDNSSKNLDLDITEYAKKNNMRYIKTGYFNDQSILTVLNTPIGKRDLVNSYDHYFTNYFIGENRGTIVESLVISLMICRYIFQDIVYGKDNNFYSKMTFDFINFTLSNVESNYDKGIFLKKMDKIIPLQPEKLKRKIDSIQETIKLLGSVPSFLESEIITIYQAFQTIMMVFDLEELELQNIYQSFVDMLSIMDEEVSYEDELRLNKYTTLVTNIIINNNKKEKMRVFDALNNLNLLTDYSERVKLQKDIYNSIYIYGNDIIEIMKVNKFKILQNENANEYLSDVLGFSKAILNSFESSIESNFKKILTSVMEVLFINEKNQYVGDFLFYREKAFVENIFEAEDIILSSLTNVDFVPEDIVNHFEIMFKEKNICIIPNEKQNDINQTIYFPAHKVSYIIINFQNGIDCLFTLCHELGHSFFNKYYKEESYYDESTQIANEILAYFVEILCINAILENNILPSDMKNLLVKNYLLRIHKSVLSTYGIHMLEKEVTKFIKEHNDLTLQDFLDIRKKMDNLHFFDDITMVNQEHSYLNVLLKSSFVFGHYNYVLTPMSYVIAIHLFEEYKSNPLALVKYKLCIAEGSTSLDNFLNRVLESYNFQEFIETSMEMLDSFINKLKTNLNNKKASLIR
jgi:hypothetical protein